jgi:hypothetical protein
VLPPGLFTEIGDPGRDLWDIAILAKQRRICHALKERGVFTMYQIAFEEFGYRMPFSDFEVAVFDHLHLAPSQLHPNSLAFMRAFEIVTTYLRIVPTLELFFRVFRLHARNQKETRRTSMDGFRLPKSAVSSRCTRSLSESSKIGG